MKKVVFIGATSMFLLLSIALGLFTVQAFSVSAKGTHKKHQPVTKATATSISRSGSGTTHRGKSPSGSSPLEQRLFTQMNNDRAAQGLPAYTLNAVLSTGARHHSVAMTQPRCGLSHQCPGEPTLGQRITNEGIHWMTCGENAGYTSPYPDAWTAVQQNIEQGMLKEQPPNDGHRKNLLSPAFHQVGIGIVIDAKGLVWVTEDFTN